MKNYFSSLRAMLFASLVLASCNSKEIATPDGGSSESGIPFEVSTVITKTANDDRKTNWASDDAINLFHAEAGTTSSYTSDGKFTVDKALTGVFSGELAKALEEDKSYDWYAFYPYNDYNKTPAGVSKDTFGYTTVGGTSQTQTDNDSMAHLAGASCPLYGVVKNVASSEKPAFEMNQLVSVVAVNVTNTLADAITVSNVSFTSTEDIVGTYYIDFSGDTPVYTSRGSSYVSETANLTVEDGAAIAQNGSATFYIAIKPHTAASGSALKISVNGLEKTLSLTKDVTFEAGHIKTVKYSYDYEAAPVIYSTEFNYTISGSSYQSSTPILGEDTDKVTSWSIVYGNWYNSCCAQMRVYKSGGGFGSLYMNFDVSKATRVEYKAKVDNNSITLNTYFSTDKGSTWTTVDSGKSLNTTLSSYSFEISPSGEYDNVRIKFEASGSRPSSTVQLTIDDVVIYGYGSIVLDPVISADDVEVEATGVNNATSAYTVANSSDDIIVKEFAGCVTSATASEGKITYSVAPNYTTAEIDGTITLVSSSNAELTKEVKVSQKKSTLSVSSTEVIISASETSADFTITTPEFGFETAVTVSEGMDLTISPASGEKNSSGQKVVVSSITEAPTEGDPITLGTIKIYRNGNEKDSQAKTIIIKKDVVRPLVYYKKVSNITDGKKYLLVDSKYNYIFNGSQVATTTPGVDASDLIVDEQIESTATTDKYAVTITTSGSYYKILLSTGKYLVINSNLTSNSTGENINIESVTGGFQLISTNKTNRGVSYRESANGFKSYAISNFGTSDYGGTFVLYELSE